MTAKQRGLAGGLLLAALLCGCSTASGTVSGTSADTSAVRTSSPSGDAALVVRLQTIGPSGRTPADVARVAGAVGCVGYQPGPYVPAGPTWEIHLRIPANRLAAALAAVHDFPGVVEVHSAALSAFSATPTAAAGGPVDATPC